MTNSLQRSVVRMSAPALEPLSVAEVKLFLRVENVTEDALIASLIMVAREAAETFTGRSFNTQSHRLVIEGEIVSLIPLPRSPIISIQTVEVTSGAGSLMTVDSANYRLMQPRGILHLSDTPIGDRLIITYAAGFGDFASDVPSIIRQGMLHHIAQLFEHREQVGGVPELSRTLYQPYREIRL